MSLTPAQKACVTFAERDPSSGQPFNLVIEAGAGAGKTTVLAQRVLWKLTEAQTAERAEPHELTIVTFTRAAEEEIRERIVDKVGARQPRLAASVAVSTIDSLLQSLMELHFPAFWMHNFSPAKSPRGTTEDRGDTREQTRLLRSPPALQIIDEVEARAALEGYLSELLDSLFLGAPAHEVAAIVDFVLAGGLDRSWRYRRDGHNTGTGPRDELIRFLTSEACLLLHSPPLEFVQRVIHPGAGILFHRLMLLGRQALLERLRFGRITHTDRLVFLHNLACAPQEAKTGSPFENFQLHIASSCTELIVDEYQDTSPVQHDILVTFAKQQNARMIVVGDPKQSLYRFRSARVEVFQQLTTQPEWRHIALSDNFRSHPDLLMELNRLARLALEFDDQHIPQHFWQTPHGRAAGRARVAPRDLSPGRIEGVSVTSDMPHPAQAKAAPPRVQILTHSLNTDRLSQDHQRRLEDCSVSYTDLSEDLLCEAVSNLLDAGIPPDSMAILCETRADCQRAAQALRAAGLPVAGDADRLQPAGATPRHSARAARALANLLATWNHGDRAGASLIQAPTVLDVFDLLTSPLVGLELDAAATLAHKLAKQWQSTGHDTHADGPRPEHSNPASPETSDLLTLCPALGTEERARHLLDLASSYPLGAWIVVMQALVSGAPGKPKTMPQPLLHELFIDEVFRWALLFSLNYDRGAPLGTALNEAFSRLPPGLQPSRSPGAGRKKAQTPLSRWMPQDMVTGTFDHQIYQDAPAHTEGGSISVRTVHSAKGLEWRAVIFVPRNTAQHRAASFRCLSLGDRNVIQWFNKEGQLEFLKRTPVSARADAPQSASQTKHATHDLRLLPDPGDRSKASSSQETDDSLLELDHQERAETGFERARVFYTAVTRAREHLVLFTGWGTSRTKKSLRDDLANLIVGESDAQALARNCKGLIKWTLASYLDSTFQLRSVRPKPGARRGSQPVEPWTQSEEATPILAEDLGVSPVEPTRVRYVDRCAPSLLGRIERVRALKQAKPGASGEALDDHDRKLRATLTTGPFSRGSLGYTASGPQPDPVPWTELWAQHAAAPAEAPLETRLETRVQGDLVGPGDEHRRRPGGRLARVQEGILVHAAEELSLESGVPQAATSPAQSERWPDLDTAAQGVPSPHGWGISVLRQLESGSATVLREYEIWLAPSALHDTEAFALQPPRRLVVDALFLCRLSHVLALIPDLPIFEACAKDTDTTQGQELRPTQAGTWAHQDPVVALVVDYKTGRPSAEHLVQVEGYMRAACELAAGHGLWVPQPDQASEGSGHSGNSTDRAVPTLFAGCLAYLSNASGLEPGKVLLPIEHKHVPCRKL